MQSLELDGEDVHFDPVDAQVTFTCTYDASYTLSSDDFMVKLITRLKLLNIKVFTEKLRFMVPTQKGK